MFGRWRASRERIAAAALAILMLPLGMSCGGDGSSPSGSTPPATATATAQPTPTAGSGDVKATCSLGAGDPNARCGKGSSRLQGTVLSAMDQLVLQQPQLFDKSEEAGGAGTGQYRVLDKEAYLNGLLGNLAAANYCAQRDPDDFDYERIQIKNENGFSETFDVLLSTGFMRRSGSYFETCTPASFPVDRGELPPAGSGCGAPYPPPISRMTCKVHFVAAAYDTLDSTAIVGPDTEYCARAGFSDGRALCPVRPEGSPERIPCETWRVGNALDTGRPGPSWTRAGQPCTGPGSGCENHPENQYQLLVYHSGTYQVCANTGSCCSVEVQR